jgi:diacylglycerol kinase (ATP)
VAFDTSLPLVIVNPGSAGGSTLRRWGKIASDLRTHFGPFSVEFTQAPGHAIEIAEAAANAGCQFIIACGGDGTINEVTNGLIRSGQDVELGVLPSGTGGDFRRSIGISPNSREAARALASGVSRKIDVGRVRFTGNDGMATERYFLNVSSVGLASAVIMRVRDSKGFSWFPAQSFRGKLNYAFSSLQEVLDLHTAMIKVSIDGGKSRQLQTVAFCIANSRFFGGGMKIAPDASLDDGLFDVVNIGHLSTAKILFNAHTLYRGTHTSLDEVQFTRARTIEITAAENAGDILLETDGELPGRLPAAYEVLPGALRVRVPRK